MLNYRYLLWFRAILKNDWNEVVDLILKPRPGGKKGTIHFGFSMHLFFLDVVFITCDNTLVFRALWTILNLKF